MNMKVAVFTVSEKSINTQGFDTSFYVRADVSSGTGALPTVVQLKRKPKL